MGSKDVLTSDITLCFTILRVSVTCIKYSLKESLLRLSFDNVSPSSTSISFDWLPYLTTMA